jgi:hypothetical protein
MKPSTIDMLRAYLITASLAATLMEAVALLALFPFGMSEEAFQSTPFRLVACASIVGAVMLIRQLARVAYRSAVANHYATFRGSHAQEVALSPGCPGRRLVILHLRFNRRLFELVDCQGKAL